MKWCCMLLDGISLIRFPPLDGQRGDFLRQEGWDVSDRDHTHKDKPCEPLTMEACLGFFLETPSWMLHSVFSYIYSGRRGCEPVFGT
jgi:hypothetical protein